MASLALTVPFRSLPSKRPQCPGSHRTGQSPRLSHMAESRPLGQSPGCDQLLSISPRLYLHIPGLPDSSTLGWSAAGGSNVSGLWMRAGAGGRVGSGLMDSHSGEGSLLQPCSDANLSSTAGWVTNPKGDHSDGFSHEHLQMHILSHQESLPVSLGWVPVGRVPARNHGQLRGTSRLSSDWRHLGTLILMMT